jgi:hypothetical protein
MTAPNWQGIPDWLIYAVRWKHAAAMAEGRERAGEDAVQQLTDKVLADDPGFTRLVVERYVRSLVRAPKPKRHGKPGARERLMAGCARMSAEGKSLREIGEANGIAHTSVRRLLAEWQTRLPEMDPELIRLAAPMEQEAEPGYSGGVTPGVPADPNVIPLRRPA